MVRLVPDSVAGPDIKLKETGRFELELALSVSGETPKVTGSSAKKLMVCDALLTVSVRCTAVAAA